MIEFVIESEWLIDGILEGHAARRAIQLGFSGQHGLVVQAMNAADGIPNIEEVIEALELSGIRLRWGDLLGASLVTSEEIDGNIIVSPKTRLTRIQRSALTVCIMPVVSAMYSYVTSLPGYDEWLSAFSQVMGPSASSARSASATQDEKTSEGVEVGGSSESREPEAETSPGPPLPTAINSRKENWSAGAMGTPVASTQKESKNDETVRKALMSGAGMLGLPLLDVKSGLYKFTAYVVWLMRTTGVGRDVAETLLTDLDAKKREQAWRTAYPDGRMFLDVSMAVYAIVMDDKFVEPSVRTNVMVRLSRTEETDGLLIMARVIESLRNGGTVGITLDQRAGIKEGLVRLTFDTSAKSTLDMFNDFGSKTIALLVEAARIEGERRYIYEDYELRATKTFIEQARKLGGDLSSVAASMSLLALQWKQVENYDFRTILEAAKAIGKDIDITKIRAERNKNEFSKGSSSGLEGIDDKDAKINRLEKKIARLEKGGGKGGKLTCYNCGKGGHRMSECKQAAKFTSKMVKCPDCSKDWEFAPTAQAYHDQKSREIEGYTIPTRCVPCRKAKRAGKSFANQEGSDDDSEDE